MLKRKMSMAWEKWQQVYQDLKFAQWQQVYQDLKFANRMGGGAIRRMLNRKLSMAWEKWQFTAAELAHQQRLLAGAVHRLNGKAASPAGWCSEPHAQAEDVDGMGEVAAGVPGSQVR
eukprot:TRINITY_DN13486_c0_g1_i18.p3 TRINITY_DN13486_c0_g1~~TRINITY_DN13486_c0_g1_i18.p3  ORF type:complete len:117 (-),score=28.80 TRINITY_DN13486_c0_g1_i18:86-436(-)